VAGLEPLHPKYREACPLKCGSERACQRGLACLKAHRERERERHLMAEEIEEEKFSPQIYIL
jgi:hypothetical protein